MGRREDDDERTRRLLSACPPTQPVGDRLLGALDVLLRGFLRS